MPLKFGHHGALRLAVGGGKASGIIWSFRCV
jgi:hypothetical protein